MAISRQDRARRAVLKIGQLTDVYLQLATVFFMQLASPRLDSRFPRTAIRVQALPDRPERQIRYA
jgi:hypothetical protein